MRGEVNRVRSFLAQRTAPAGGLQHGERQVSKAALCLTAHCMISRASSGRDSSAKGFGEQAGERGLGAAGGVTALDSLGDWDECCAGAVACLVFARPSLQGVPN